MHITVSIIPPDPIQNILLVKIIAELKVLEENPEVVWINSSMRKLVNMPEYLQVRKVLNTHQLLLFGLNGFNRLDFPLANPQNSMLYIVTYLGVGIVKTIRVISLGIFEMISGRVGQGSYKLLETIIEEKRNLRMGLKMCVLTR